MRRDIIRIDEELCNGCGACVTGCAEGALAVVDGKARLVSDVYCDGLGACLGHCPTGALTIEVREAPKFDEAAALARLRPMCKAVPAGPLTGDGPSALGHWPVKIRLVPPDAPFLDGADLVVAADCAPVACPSFHADFVPGKAVLTGCPKFDGQADYAGRFAELFATSNVRSVTVLRMEVPCCGGLPAMVAEGVRRSGRDIPVTVRTVTRRGAVVDEAK